LKKANVDILPLVRFIPLTAEFFKRYQYLYSIAVCGAATQIIGRVDQKYLESFEM